tara:strand:- start:25199 stop:26089 length:891 start_codon:yes stop_codon:yes gene_type:complete
MVGEILDKKHKTMKYKEHVTIKEAELSKMYEELSRITTEKQLELARELLSQIGRVSVANETFNTSENQRKQSVKFVWGHNHIFNNNLKVTGQMADRHINSMAQFMVKYNLPNTHFQDKDVLDVGCWTGGTTLMLKILGADHVLALEEVQKYASTANVLVNEIYQQKNVICKSQSLYEFESDKKYDIVYCPGVVYHLSDPTVGLRRLFNSLKDGGEIFVETTAFDSGPVKGDWFPCARRGNAHGYTPSIPCLNKWLEDAGFTETQCSMGMNNRGYGYGKRRAHVEISKAGLSQPHIS